MSWTYRIGFHTLPDGPHFGIYEIYDTHDEAKDPALVKIKAWSAAPIEPSGESLDELKRDMARMLKAFDHKAIDLDALKRACDAKEALLLGDWSP